MAILTLIKNGDFNTEFFHTHAWIRNYKIKILTIVDDDGWIHNDHSNIGNYFLDFNDKL